VKRQKANDSSEMIDLKQAKGLSLHSVIGMDVPFKKKAILDAKLNGPSLANGFIIKEHHELHYDQG
jgi:hypothetical protein